MQQPTTQLVQPTYDQFENLTKACCLIDKEKRAPAENGILLMHKSFPNEFILYSLNFLMSNTDLSALLLACVNLKNLVGAVTSSESILFLVKNETFELLKTRLTEVLFRQNVHRSFTVQVAHCIAMVESVILDNPNRFQWNGFLENLFTLTKNENALIRECSLVIFMDLAENNTKFFMPYCSSLAGILSETVKDKESLNVRLASVTAIAYVVRTAGKDSSKLKYFIPLIKDIMSLLNDLLSKGDYLNVSNIFISLMEIAKVCPSFFEGSDAFLAKFLINIAHTCTDALTKSKNAKMDAQRGGGGGGGNGGGGNGGGGNGGGGNGGGGNGGGGNGGVQLSDETEMNMMDMRKSALQLVVILSSSFPKTLRHSQGQSQNDYGPFLFRTITELMLTFEADDNYEEDDEDDDPYDIIDDCRYYVSEFGEAVKGKYLFATVLDPIKNLLSSTNWRARNAGYHLLNSIIPGCENSLPKKRMREITNLALLPFTFASPEMVRMAAESNNADAWANLPSNISPFSDPFSLQNLIPQDFLPSEIPSSSLSSSPSSPSPSPSSSSLIPAIREPCLRVAVAACSVFSALAEIKEADYLEKDTFAFELLQTLLLLLLSPRTSSAPTVRLFALSSLNECIESTPVEKLKPLMRPLVYVLAFFSFTTPVPQFRPSSKLSPHALREKHEKITKNLRNEAICALIMLIDQAGESISPYLLSLATPLNTAVCASLPPLSSSYSSDLLELDVQYQGNCINCFSALLQAVGSVRAAPFLSNFMGQVIRIFQEAEMNNTELENEKEKIKKMSAKEEKMRRVDERGVKRMRNEDTRVDQVRTVWNRLSELLRMRFSVALQYVIPPLLKSAAKRIEISESEIDLVIKNNPELLGGLVDAVQPVQSSIELRSEGEKKDEDEDEDYGLEGENPLNDRESAFVYLVNFANNVGPYFAPYAEECFRVGMVALKEYKDEKTLFPSSIAAQLVGASIACLCPVLPEDENHPSKVKMNEEKMMKEIQGFSSSSASSKDGFKIDNVQLPSLPPTIPLPSNPKLHPLSMFMSALPVFYEILDYKDMNFVSMDLRIEVLKALQDVFESLAPLLNPSSPSFANVWYPWGSDCYLSRADKALSMTDNTPVVLDPSIFLQFIFSEMKKTRERRINLLRETGYFTKSKKKMKSSEEDEDIKEIVEHEKDYLSTLNTLLTLLWKIYGVQMYPTFRKNAFPLLFEMAKGKPRDEKMFAQEIDRVSALYNLSDSLVYSYPNSTSNPDYNDSLHSSPTSSALQNQNASSNSLLSNINQTSSIPSPEQVSAVNEMITAYMPVFLYCADVSQPLVQNQHTARGNAFSGIYECSQTGSPSFKPFVKQSLNVIQSALNLEKDEDEEEDEDEDNNNEVLDKNKKDSSYSNNEGEDNEEMNDEDSDSDSSDADEDSNDPLEAIGTARDYCLGALLSICIKHEDAIIKEGGDPKSLLLLWLRKLPMNMDEDITKPCYDELGKMIDQRNVTVFGWNSEEVSSQVLKILAEENNFTIVPITTPAGKVIHHLFVSLVQVVKLDLLTEKTEKQFIQLLHILKKHFSRESLKDVWDELNENNQKNLIDLFR